MKNKGVVFTFDALFALMLVAVAIPMIIVFMPTQDISNQDVSLKAESAIDTLSRLKIRNVIMEPSVSELYSDGILTDSDLNRSVMEVVVDFWSRNNAPNLTIAQNITFNILNASLIKGNNWVLSINNETIYDTGGVSKKTTGIGNRMASGFMKGNSSTGYTASAYITSIGGKRATSYFYFGGFVGQGNISASVYDVPSNANINDIYLELNAGDNFSFYANSALCGVFNITPGDFSVNTWNITGSCINSINKGSSNTFKLNFTSNNLTSKYIGGGYIRVDYNTTDLLYNDNGLFYYRFPGEDTIVNLYDSFYVPGTIKSMNANISLLTPLNYTAIMYVGNTTVLNYTGNGSQVLIRINDADFKANFTANNVPYSGLSSTTVPIRMVVLANISGGFLNGNADVVLITDLSNSMAWKLGIDNQNGQTRLCDNPSLYNSDTSRISLAKCLDKSFVNAILGGPNSTCNLNVGANGNRIALVSFNRDANTWESLTQNVGYLETKINAYAASGSTCISCAINRAYQILGSQSGPTRNKFIVFMTDGQPNYDTTSIPFDTKILHSISRDFIVGDLIYAPTLTNFHFATAIRTPDWLESNVFGNAGVDNALYGVSSLNSTYAWAVSDKGKIYSWSVDRWVQNANLGGVLYSVDAFNTTLAFAVGSSAKIYKWNGLSWAQDYDAGAFDFNGVKIFNSTLAFAVGDSGNIYKWNGATWSSDFAGGTPDFNSVDVKNETFGLAVGSSGKVYTWNGVSWSNTATMAGITHNSVSIFNKTLAFIASTAGNIYTWNGNFWTNFNTEIPIPRTFYGVYALNETLAYAVGDGAMNDTYTWNGVSWSRTYAPFFYYGNLTDGTTGYDVDCNNLVNSSFPALAANYSAYVAYHNINNLTIDTVGIGPMGTCNLANQTLLEMSKNGNGTSYTSTDGAELSGIYCAIANNILTKTTPTQQIITQGKVDSSSMFPESFIEFNYTNPNPPGYQQISVDTETSPAIGCQINLILTPKINITSVLKTSYSGFYWTKNVYTSDIYGTYQNYVYNLSSFSKNYTNVGDPFKVYIPISALQTNLQTNVITTELGLNDTDVSTDCSNNDRIIYSGRIKASVPTGNVFPKLSGGVIRVYYDLDHNGFQDGYVDVSLGANLPNFNSTVRNVNDLDTANNALEDAFQRLLNNLDFNFANNLGGRLSGSFDNPIDVKLSDVQLGIATSGGIPFTWGPVDVRLDVKV